MQTLMQTKPMTDNPPAKLGKPTEAYVLEKATMRHCQLRLEGFDKPVAGIEYKGEYYSFFRFLPTWDEAEKIANRLKGTCVITPVKKGWVIWAYEY